MGARRTLTACARMQMLAGPGGQETLLAGLADGCVLRITLGSPFPECLLQHSAAVR